MSNAIKFTEDGFIKLSAILTENHLTIIIKDTGVGINLAKQEKLFEPFEQGNNPLSKKYSGTGLGLAIVKRLIELLNGKIEVDTKLNHGTEFNINIPIEIVNEGTILTSNNNKIESNKKLRIILAEDMKINQLLIEKIISKENPAWELTIVENGNDLIEKLKEKEYDIILMDIKMPQLNGIETTKIIREQLGNKDIVIIAVSAYALDENIAIALDAGVNSYVSKPINKDELIEKIIMYTSTRKD